MRYVIVIKSHSISTVTSTRTTKSDNEVKPIPDNYPALTPYVCCKNAATAIEFYKNAFGAKEE